MKELLIKQCQDTMMWYAGKVGQTVPLLREDDHYWSRDNSGCLNIIHKEDAEIVGFEKGTVQDWHNIDYKYPE